MLQPNSKSIACMTGLRDPNLIAKYEAYLGQLGFHSSHNFLHQTDILIVASVLKEKYKIWRHFSKRIPCVTLKWLEDCHSEGKLLPTKEYEISTVFYGSQIGICGFSEEVSLKMKALVEELDGVASIIHTEEAKGSTRRISELKIDSNLEVIVMDKKFYQRACMQMAEINVPCVGLEWLSQCRSKRQCKYPLDYSYNYYDLRIVKRDRQIAKLKKKLDSRLSEPLIEQPHIGTLRSNSQQTSGQQSRIISSRARPFLKQPLFSNCLIHLHCDSIDPNLYSVIKKLIFVEDGIVLDLVSPLVTHLVVDNIAQSEFHNLLKYGDAVSIVRVEWVIDSLLFESRMQEVDYMMRSFSCFKDEKMGSKLSSHSFGMHGLGMMHKRPNMVVSNNQVLSATIEKTERYEQRSYNQTISEIMRNRSSISLPLSAFGPCIVKKKVQFKSEVLKGLYFYIPQRFRKDKDLRGLVTTIRQNAGIAYDKPKSGVNMFCIIIDAPEMQAICRDVIEGHESQLQPISPRWVYYCVKKGVLIDFNTPGYFIFKPFKFKVPLFAFMTYKIDIVGVSDCEKMRLRELICELGSKRMKPSVYEMTHCLCGDNLTDENSDRRIKQVQSGNPKTKFVKLKWIFDCMHEGFINPELEEYQVQFSGVQP